MSLTENQGQRDPSSGLLEGRRPRFEVADFSEDDPQYSHICEDDQNHRAEEEDEIQPIRVHPTSLMEKPLLVMTALCSIIQ